MPKPNPNRIDRQHEEDSPPPPSAGQRDAPGDTTDWTAVGHQEAEAQRREGDAVPATHGEHAGGGGRPKPSRTES